MMKFLSSINTFFTNTNTFFQSIPDEYKYSFLGTAASVTFMSILDAIQTLVMAFLVGGMGALGGFVVKKLVDKFKKR